MYPARHIPLSTMTSSVALPSEDVLVRLGLETPIARIDRALKEFWTEDEAKTRASLINLASKLLILKKMFTPILKFEA